MTAGARVGAWSLEGVGQQFDVEPYVSAGIPEDDRRATTLITRESDRREEAYQQANYCKVMPTRTWSRTERTVSRPLAKAAVLRRES